jgi:hypothetical protein
MVRFKPGQDVKVVKATINEVDCLGAVGKVCQAPMMAPAHVLIKTAKGRYLTLPDSFLQHVTRGRDTVEAEA